jgi:hypothetical protein
MSAVRDAVTNLISSIESGTALTRYGGTSAFVHEPRAYTIDQLETHQQPTRRFIVLPAGDRERDGRMSQPGNPEGVYETWVVTIAYRVGPNAHETRLVIAEDEQYLADRLEHPSLWGSPQTVQQRDVLAAAVEEPEGLSQGNVVLMDLPVRFKYRPTFSL